MVLDLLLQDLDLGLEEFVVGACPRFNLGNEQLGGVVIELVLLELAAVRVHAGAPGHHLDLRPDDPVLHRAQIDRGDR